MTNLVHDEDGAYLFTRFPLGSEPCLSIAAAKSRIQHWVEDASRCAALRRALAAGAWPRDPGDLCADDLGRYIISRVSAGQLYLCRVAGPWSTMKPSVGPLDEMPLAIGDNASGLDHEGESDEILVVDPCDFDRVTIKCSHMPDPDPWGNRKMADGAQFWWERGTAKNNLRQVQGRPYGEVIEVVAGAVRYPDKISISLDGGPGYTCSHNHPRITITEERSKEALVFEGKTTAEFEAKSRELLPVLSNPTGLQLLSFFYFPDGTSNTYVVEVEACGCRSTAGDGVGRSRHEVLARPIDLYKLSLSLPALKKTTYEKSAGISDRLSLVTAEERTVEKGLGWSESDREKTTTKKASEKHLLSPKQITAPQVEQDDVHPLVEAARSFKFERDGEDIKGTEAIGEFIYTLIEAEKQLKEISDFIRDFQPQVGWKFVYELELFKGELSCEWGFKEWEDHTVYRWWALEVAMTLIAFKAEVRFGAGFRVCGCTIECFVFGNFSIDAKLGLSAEASPEDPKPFESVISSESKGELGLRSRLGGDWAHAEGKLVVSMKFTAKVQLSTKEPLHIDWRIDYGGIYCHVVGHVKWVGAIDRKWKVAEEKKPLTYGSIPARDKPSPPATAG